jgi:putative ABC transport system permease protein
MQDLRLAIRALRATPIVTAVVVLSLALGIGANTAIFSLVNSLLLRNLPVAHPQRLVVVSTKETINQGFPAASVSYTMWDQFRQRGQLFDGAAAWSQQRVNLAQRGEMQPVDGMFVSGDFFGMLGVSALLGRVLTPEDDRRGGGTAGPVAVISYGLWQRRWGGTASVIGTPLVVEAVPFTIVGVTPPDFLGPEVGRGFDVALPLGTESLVHGKDALLDTPLSFLWVMLRLHPDQSLEAATAALRSAQPQIRRAAMPPDMPPRFQPRFLNDDFVLLPAAEGPSRLRQRYERPLLTILVVVALVLLIACANIANLQLARATARRHELSVRLALGASPWRLARQWLVESVVLASTGAVLALVVAAWSSRVLVAQLSTSVTRIVMDLSLDWRVLTFTTAVTGATAVLFGTAPAFRGTRIAPMEALNEYGRCTSSDARGALSSGLVVGQVAVSLVLVVAAGLFVRTFERLASEPLGFDRDRVLVVTVNTTRAHLDAAQRSRFYDRLVGAVAAVPGVAHAAGSMFTPTTGGYYAIRAEVAGAPPMAEGDRAVQANVLTPGWFATYGTAIQAGRDIEVHDTATAPPVLLVNEAFVRKFFPGRHAIGETVVDVLGPRAVPYTVVGVVGDAVYRSPRDGVRPTVYLPLAQVNVPAIDLSISVRASAASVTPSAHSIATALTAIDRDLAFSFRPLADQVNASLTQERVIALLSGFFGALALLLAGLGLYGVTSYTVSRQRTEIGIRMALGAAPSGIVGLVLARVALLLGTGVIVGAGVSVWASTFVASLLFGLQPRDPVTLAASVVVLAIVGVLASWFPAYRASRIDPADVLREG